MSLTYQFVSLQKTKWIRTRHERFEKVQDRQIRQPELVGAVGRDQGNSENLQLTHLAYRSKLH